MKVFSIICILSIGVTVFFSSCFQDTVEKFHSEANSWIDEAGNWREEIAEQREDLKERREQAREAEKELKEKAEEIEHKRKRGEISDEEAERENRKIRDELKRLEEEQERLKEEQERLEREEQQRLEEEQRQAEEQRKKEEGQRKIESQIKYADDLMLEAKNRYFCWNGTTSAISTNEECKVSCNNSISEMSKAKEQAEDILNDLEEKYPNLIVDNTLCQDDNRKDFMLSLAISNWEGHRCFTSYRSAVGSIISHLSASLNAQKEHGYNWCNTNYPH